MEGACLDLVRIGLLLWCWHVTYDRPMLASPCRVERSSHLGGWLAPTGWADSREGASRMGWTCDFGVAGWG
jgi:hypothetical protein